MARWIREVWGWRSSQSSNAYVLSCTCYNISLMSVSHLALAPDPALVEVLALQHPRNFSTIILPCSRQFFVSRVQ